MHEMTRGGMCALPDGHSGPHRSRRKGDPGPPLLCRAIGDPPRCSRHGRPMASKGEGLWVCTSRPCTVDDCEKFGRTRGLCAMHYRRLRLYGDPVAPARCRHGELAADCQTCGAPCQVEDCSLPMSSRGLCRLHWQRWRRHGDPSVILVCKPVFADDPVPRCTEHGDLMRPNSRPGSWACNVKTRARFRQRRARGRAAFHRPYEPSDVFALTGGICAYCGDPAAEIDHVVAVANGGPDAEGNVVPACVRCNRSKRDRDDAWIEDHAPAFLGWWWQTFMEPLVVA